MVGLMAFLQPECSPMIVQMVARFLFAGRHTERDRLFSNPVGPQIHLQTIDKPLL